MIQSNQNEQIIKVGNWVAVRLNKFESILTFIFLLVMGLKMGTKLNVNVFLVLTLLTLANLYFFNAFSVHENASGMEIFLNKIIAIFCSASVIGILFRILHWPGYEIMLPISCIALILSLAGILYLKSKKKEVKVFDQRTIIRIVTIVAVGLIMLLMSNEPLKEAIV